MLLQIDDAFLQCFHVFCGKLCLWNSAVIFQGADRCDQYDCIRREVCLSALDIKELLCTEVCTKTRFGHDIICHGKGCCCRTDAVTAMRDIGKRTAMDKSRCMLQCLDHVWQDGIL